MIVKQIKLSNKAKEQLIRLKSKTGISQWNILCRFALCLSLKEPTPPFDDDSPTDSNVEMTWQVFGGEYQDVYEALIIQRCLDDGLGTDPNVLSKQFKLHLHRRKDRVAAYENKMKKPTDILKLTLNEL